MAFTATPPRCETCGRWHIPNDPPDCAHEPECGFMTDETLDCICGEIRACEARVRADERDKAAGRVEEAGICTCDPYWDGFHKGQHRDWCVLTVTLAAIREGGA